MTTKLAKHTPGALRAATILARLARDAARMSGAKMVGGNNLPQAQIDGFAMIIDGETNHPAMLEALESALSFLSFWDDMRSVQFVGSSADLEMAQLTISKKNWEEILRTCKRSREAICAAVGEKEENTQ
jgi:hypothetical protein